MHIRNIWPIKSSEHLLDRAALGLRFLPGFCNICGNPTIFWVNNRNFREHVICLHCRSCNRHRQIASVLLSYVLGSGSQVPRLASLKDIPRSSIIWNAENTRSLHHHLAKQLGTNYISSEFLDPSLPSGKTVDGVLHVDMQSTHFADNSIDFILSSDVIEHVPEPLIALAESYRILKTGGCHIFTAPFYHHRFTNEKRAVVNATGDVEFLRRPWYHDDPVRAEGTLVYTVFAPQLLCDLEALGFEARLCILHSLFHGILGSNGIVIVAKKVKEPNHARDWIFS